MGGTQSQMGTLHFPMGKQGKVEAVASKPENKACLSVSRQTAALWVSTLLLTPPNKQKVSNNNKKPDTQEIHWVFFEARAYVQVFEDTVGKAVAVSMACQTSEEGFCLPAYERRKEV